MDVGWRVYSFYVERELTSFSMTIKTDSKSSGDGEISGLGWTAQDLRTGVWDWNVGVRPSIVSYTFSIVSYTFSIASYSSLLNPIRKSRTVYRFWVISIIIVEYFKKVLVNWYHVNNMDKMSTHMTPSLSKTKRSRMSGIHCLYYRCNSRKVRSKEI